MQIILSTSTDNLMVTSISLVDNFGFIASGNSVKEIARTLETVARTVLEWDITNAVTYDTSKTEAVVFTKSHR